jgi:hypothetical protein
MGHVRTNVGITAENGDSDCSRATWAPASFAHGEGYQPSPPRLGPYKSNAEAWENIEIIIMKGKVRPRTTLLRAEARYANPRSRGWNRKRFGSGEREARIREKTPHIKGKGLAVIEKESARKLPGRGTHGERIIRGVFSGCTPSPGGREAGRAGGLPPSPL